MLLLLLLLSLLLISLLFVLVCCLYSYYYISLSSPKHRYVTAAAKAAAAADSRRQGPRVDWHAERSLTEVHEWVPSRRLRQLMRIARRSGDNESGARGREQGVCVCAASPRNENPRAKSRCLGGVSTASSRGKSPPRRIIRGPLFGHASAPAPRVSRLRSSRVSFVWETQYVKAFDPYVYIYIYIYGHVYIYIYIYIYRERER